MNKWVSYDKLGINSSIVLDLPVSEATGLITQDISKSRINMTFNREGLPGWNNRIAVTISPDNIDDTLTNFPVKLWLSESSGISASDLSSVFNKLGSDANRKKIAVTTSDGLTQCYVEIADWDTANKQAELHVRVPTILSGAETILYLYYDSTHVDNDSYVGDTTSTPAKAVWDSSFSAVYHMNDGADTSHIYDSTSNINHGTKLEVNMVEFVGTGESCSCYHDSSNWNFFGSTVLVGNNTASDLKYGASLRWTSVAIPNKAVITTAYFKVTAKSALNSGTVINSVITGRKLSTATAITNLSEYQAARGTIVGGADDDDITDASVAWNAIAAWTGDVEYSSPELKTIIQEIVNQAGWESGNSLGLFWDDHAGNSDSGATRYAYNYSAGTPDDAPVLHIEYTVPPEARSGETVVNLGTEYRYGYSLPSVSDGTYWYISIGQVGSSPYHSKVLKVRQSDMVVVGEWTSSVTGNYGESGLALGASGLLYVCNAGYTHARVDEIDTSDMTSTANYYENAAICNTAWCDYYDGYLYFSVNNNSEVSGGGFYKLRVSDMTIVGSYVPTGTLTNQGFGQVICDGANGYLYACFVEVVDTTRTAYFFKFDISDMSLEDTCSFEIPNVMGCRPKAMTMMGDYIYPALHTFVDYGDFAVYKIDKATMTLQDTYNADSEACESIANDGTHLYASSAIGGIYRINPSNMELVVKESSYSWASIIVNGSYIYGQFESPYSCDITKFPISSLLATYTKTTTAKARTLEVDGLKGKAQEFDAVDDYISVTNSVSLNPTSAITLETMLKINSFPSAGAYATPLFKGGDSQWYFRLNGTGHTITIVMIIDGVYKSVASDELLQGEYYHISATYDGTNLKIFVNAVQKNTTSATGSINTSSSNLFLGSDVATWFIGSHISMIRISSMDRSDAWKKATNYNLRDTLVSFGSPEIMGAWTQLASRQQVILLSGAGDFLESPAAGSTELNFTSEDFTLESWVLLNTNTGTHMIMCQGVYEVDGWEFFLFCIGGGKANIAFRTNQVGGHTEIAAVSGLTTGTWQLVGLTRHGSSAQFYVNGLPVTTLLGAGLTDPVSCAGGNKFTVGIRNLEDANFFNGSIGRTRIWSRELSSNEMGSNWLYSHTAYGV